MSHNHSRKESLDTSESDLSAQQIKADSHADNINPWQDDGLHRDDSDIVNTLKK